jgi:hypothetical protein
MAEEVKVELTRRELEILYDALTEWYDPDFQYHTTKEYNALKRKIERELSR